MTGYQYDGSSCIYDDSSYQDTSSYADLCPVNSSTSPGDASKCQCDEGFQTNSTKDACIVTPRPVPLQAPAVMPKVVTAPTTYTIPDVAPPKIKQTQTTDIKETPKLKKIEVATSTVVEKPNVITSPNIPNTTSDTSAINPDVKLSGESPNIQQPDSWLHRVWKFIWRFN
jgi:hypothetical protein